MGYRFGGSGGTPRAGWRSAEGTKLVHVHLPDVGPVDKESGSGVIHVKVQIWITQ
jgi:hypothetical protein